MSYLHSKYITLLIQALKYKASENRKDLVGILQDLFYKISLAFTGFILQDLFGILQISVWIK